MLTLLFGIAAIFVFLAGVPLVLAKYPHYKKRAAKLADVIATREAELRGFESVYTRQELRNSPVAKRDRKKYAVPLAMARQKLVKLQQAQLIRWAVWLGATFILTTIAILAS